MLRIGVLTSALLAVFITLKALNLIAWDWWVVLSPFWIPELAILVLGAINWSLARFNGESER